MKNVLLGTLGLLALAIGLWSFMPVEDSSTLNGSVAADAKIEWLTWDEAVKRMDDEPKKIFVDVYTEWCGWCKKMDKSTFLDPKVIKAMNAEFYAVKFDAEQREEVNYKNTTLRFRADAGRRGVHELAYSLLDGRMSYPSFVYLDENQNRITISPGYKTGDMMFKELLFIGEDHFKTTKFEQFTVN